MKEKPWHSSWYLLSVIKSKTRQNKIAFGKAEKGVQTLKPKRHSTFIHPKEKSFHICGFCVKQFFCFSNGFNARICLRSDKTQKNYIQSYDVFLQREWKLSFLMPIADILLYFTSRKHISTYTQTCTSLNMNDF